jgi:hypothetical protein
MDCKRAIVGPDDNIYVSSRGTDEVVRFNGQTGAFMDVFVSAGSGGIGGPLGSSFGPDGNLYVAGQYSSNVVRYDGATGAPVDVFVPAGTGGLKRRSLFFTRLYPSRQHFHRSRLASCALVLAAGTKGNESLGGRQPYD